MISAPRTVPLLGAALVLLLGCSRTADDLREWRPSDHRQAEESTGQGAEESPQVSGSAEPPMPGLDEVTIASYRRACAGCHGQLGRGDGPQGPMVKARDLSDPAWQAATTDAQIAATITHGRGLMPAFTLPENTVNGLVHLVRLFDRNRIAALRRSEAAPATSGSAAPPPSAAPSATPSARTK